MNWDVVASGDGERWAAALARVGCRDPYYLAAYHDAYGYDGGQSFLYVAEDGGETLIHPFRLLPITQVGARPVAPGLHDVESVYGYAGPLATCGDPAFLAQAWAGFEPWLAERRVVSEFCRFHPVLRSERFAPPGMNVLHDRDVVAIDLTQGAEAVWAGYESVQRNRVRKAQGAGLSLAVQSYGDGRAAFVPLYEATMRMLGAGEFYYFQPAYWDNLARLGEALAVATVSHGGTPIAAALFLVADGVVHYHLGGSLPESRGLGPNNLLFHGIAAWAMERGGRMLLLGGGRSNRDDDELLRFKARFSRLRLPFHLGKRVVDAAAYGDLSALWQEESGRVPPPVLQHYRLPTGGTGA